MIEEILLSSKERGFKDAIEWPSEERRDLVASARAMKNSGIIPIIAEIKPIALGRALTQKEVAAYAKAYADYSACAISVLTEPTHFKGCLENAKIARNTGLPILRKDFIFDQRQLREVQADLVLLIAALDIDLDRFIDAARSIGIEPLVEVHTDREMDKALKADAKIIGINNRDLNTMEINLTTFEHLAPVGKNAGAFLVAESGIHNNESALRMMHAGADVLLVGTALMGKPEKLADLSRLK